MTRLSVRTTERRQLVEITAKVSEAVRASGVADGAVLVYCPHTTAAITIQENADPDVVHDLLLALENAVPGRPTRGAFRHAEGNSDAHVQSSLIGASQLIPLSGGQLVLGTWQGVWLCEFDGPRQREVVVQVLAGSPADVIR